RRAPTRGAPTRPLVGMAVAALICLSWLSSTKPAAAQTAPPAEQKQDQPPAPPAQPSAAPSSGQKAAPESPPQPPPGPPPLPVLLGFADFMLTIDRPYEAEKIYKGILAFDPNNAAALTGLR